MSLESCPAPASGLFLDGEHRFPVRIYYEDTDLSGRVYHANYLRFMERARSDMLRLCGIDQRAGLEAGTGGYAVVDLSIRYLGPARLDDELVVRSRIDTLTPVRCIMSQNVWCDETELTRASVTVAFIDMTGRPRRQPPDWLDRFETFALKATSWKDRH